MMKDPQRITHKELPSDLVSWFRPLSTFAQMTSFGFKLHYTKEKAKYTGIRIMLTIVALLLLNQYQSVKMRLFVCLDMKTLLINWHN